MARTYAVTRHAGARDWFARNGYADVEIIRQFNISYLQTGLETIIGGTLPIHLVAQVRACDGTYLHLSMTIPADARGKELTADDMDTYGVTLVPFTAAFDHPTT